MNILKRLKLSFSIAFGGKQLVKNQPSASEVSSRLFCANYPQTENQTL